MVWTYTIENNEFDAEKFLALCDVDNADLPVSFDEPYPIDIDIDYYYHSDIYHSDNYYNIKITGSIVGLTTTAGSAPFIPCVYFYLGDTYTQDYCGVMVRSGNYDTRSTLTVTLNDVVTETKTNDISIGDTFSGVYTSNNPYIVVHHCTLPILIACQMGWWVETYPDYCYDYMWYNEGWSEDVPTEIKDLAWNRYHPITSPKLTAELLNKVMNLAEPAEEIPKEYIYISKGVKGEWTAMDEFYVDNTAPVLYKGLKIRYNVSNATQGKVSAYKMPYSQGDTDLKMGLIVDEGAIGVYYCYDDGITWQQMSTPVLPFQWVWRSRNKEVGTFYSSIGSHGNWQLPIFKDRETAEDYMDGLISIREADNYNEISGNYEIENPTGLPENLTQFGECYTRNIFSQLYLCNTSALYDISNALFDYDVTTLSGLWNDIKKGLEMYGSNPIDVVQGLRFYPFDLSSVFTSVQDQNYVYFGAYQLQLTNGSVKKVIYCNGSLDLGTMKLERTFNDWRDFPPYTKLSIYLPYVGIFPLDAQKYYGKETTVKYLIDLRTGACTACLIVNGVLTDWFDGIIGTDMPISLTDYSSYAQSQLNIIMRNSGLGVAGGAASVALGVKGVKNAMQNVEREGNSGLSSSLADQTAGQGMAALGSVAALGATVGVATAAAGAFYKTAYDVLSSGTAAHTKTKPASSAMINQYLPQYPYFRFEILEIDESEYLNELYGRPTNKSGLLGDFSGYLEAEDIMLICPIATDNERQEIIDLVRSGIYI